MGLTLVEPATDPLVTTAEAKLWAKVDDTVAATEDAVINGLIAAATARIEEYLGRSVRSHSWALSLCEFADEIELPRGPVRSVSEITYLDESGAQQTLDPSIYAVDLVSNPQRVLRVSAESWPLVGDAPNAVTISFVAGFEDGWPALSVIKQACLSAVAYWYDNRTDPKLPEGVINLIQPFKRMVL